MTFLYIDMEHPQVLGDSQRRQVHRDTLAVAAGRLETVAEQECVVVPFHEVSTDSVGKYGARAVVLSGSTTDWSEYETVSQTGLVDLITTAPVPILGICAGHQFIGHTHGAPWDALGWLKEGEIDSDPSLVPGWRKELGFMPVDLDLDCILFRNLPERAIFLQSHYWELQGIPSEFRARASSPLSPVQAIERIDRPVFGIQFHAERYDTAHPAGEIVLRNFFDL